MARRLAGRAGKGRGQPAMRAASITVRVAHLSGERAGYLAPVSYPIAGSNIRVAVKVLTA